MSRSRCSRLIAIQAHQFPDGALLAAQNMSCVVVESLMSVRSSLSSERTQLNWLYDFQWGDPFMLLIFAVG
jgi:hypothetical protein